jgi:general secretion pathway protein D
MMKTNFQNQSFRWAISAVMAGGWLAATSLHAQNNTFNPSTSAITFTTQPVETGPILDVVPYVLSDGYTINLALIPSLTDFNGYDQTPNIPAVTGNLNVVQLPIVLPDFTVRQVVTTVNVWDNQTVVIGGLISSQVQSTKDEVPVIGDLPLLGRLFQSQSKHTVKKNLMIFVTATIVDPAGNRVHSDDELPFAQTAVPTQPPGAGQPTETVQKVRMPGQDQ